MSIYKKDFINEEDLDFIRGLAIAYTYTMANRSNDDYVVNKPQMEKFCRTASLFQSFLDDCDGELDPIMLEPKEESGHLTGYAYVYDISGDNARKFCEIISNASAVSIDALNNGKVCISLTVPEVYIEKSKR